MTSYITANNSDIVPLCAFPGWFQDGVCCHRSGLPPSPVDPDHSVPFLLCAVLPCRPGAGVAGLCHGFES